MRNKLFAEKCLCLIFVILLVCCICFTGCTNSNNELVSPNGKIKVTYTDTPDAFFNISYSETGNNAYTHVVTLSDIGVITQNNDCNLKLVRVSVPRLISDQYTMIQGKRSSCMNEAIEQIFTFKDSKETILDVIFRVYNDGIAFRYTFPDAGPVIMADERTTFHIPPDIKRWTQKLCDSYEDFYPVNIDGIGENEGGEWAFPALFEISASVWMLITEAGIEKGDCGSWLRNDTNRSAYKIQLSDDELICPAGWKSPWRIAIIGNLSDIVESTLVTDVSTPCRLVDTSWIHPGMVSWIYWAHNHGSKDYRIVKQYIDFAAEMQLPYVLIDWEWDEMGNGGNLQDALQYAKQKNVNPLLWYNSSTAWVGKGAAGPLFRLNSPENREKEFAWLNEQGVKGIKVDFFNQDSASTMGYFLDLLEDAAKHQLLINFHGATIPRGWQRTYPHMMTVEGVYGAEWYNNNATLTPNAAWHNATLPFTRNVVGPMDYTPCTFTDSQYPHITSNSHELALLVIFESALQHLADRPEGYYSQPEAIRSFIKNLPTTWDDTKLISGYPSEYIILARRKADTWYIAGLNGTDEPKQYFFNPDFIKNILPDIQLFSDGTLRDEFNIQTISVNPEGYSIDCLPRGGFVMVVDLKKQQPY